MIYQKNNFPYPLKTIHFLAYINRSGSTLLSKELSKFEDIDVTLEGLETRFTNVDYEKFLLSNEKDLDLWLDRIYAEKKFIAWNINRGELKNELLDFGFPINYNNFLTITINKYFENSGSKILLYKDTGLFNNLDKSTVIFPKSKYLFILRDPRAIFNSLSKSIDSITGKIMTDNVFEFAITYKSIIKKIIFYQMNKKYSKSICIVIYEDLILFPDEVIKEIIKYFNVSVKTKKIPYDYEAFIPKEQKHLHKNIKNNLMENRINAWETELSKQNIWFLSFVLKNEIKRYHYKKSEIKFTEIENKLKTIINLLKFIIYYHPKMIIKLLLIRLKIRKLY